MQFTKAKAIAAAVVGVIVTVVVAVQTAMSDGVFTTDEKFTVLLVFLGAVGGTLAVHQVPNKVIPPVGPNA